MSYDKTDEREIVPACKHCKSKVSDLFHSRFSEEYFCSDLCEKEFNEIFFLNLIKTQIRIGNYYNAIALVEERIEGLS